MRLEEMLASDPLVPRWEEWRELPPVQVPEIDGFAVEVRLLDVPGTVAAVRAGEEPEAQLLATLRRAVTGWRGLTVAGLRRLLPMARFRGEVPEGAEFAYNPENLEALLKRSFLFVNWLLRVMELRRNEEEELEKNSSATRRGSLTPQPAPAGGATGKKSSSA